MITTSGVLVTLLFALAALSTKSKSFVFPQLAEYLLVVGLAFFFCAAITAILINAPFGYEEAAVAGLKKGVEQDISASEVERNNARTNLKILADAKAKNQIKGILLFRSMVFQALAVLFLAASIGVVVNRHATLWVGGVLVGVVMVSYLRAYGLGRPTGVIWLAMSASIAPLGGQQAPQRGSPPP